MTTLEFIEQTMNIQECDYKTACEISRDILVRNPQILYGIEVGKNLKITRRVVYDSGTTRAI